MIDEKRCKQLGGTLTTQGCMPNTVEAEFNIYKAEIVDELRAHTSNLSEPVEIASQEIYQLATHLKREYDINLSKLEGSLLQKLRWLLDTIATAKKVITEEGWTPPYGK